eukprot:8155959-Alexandrium_andersonii.AAC.1
MDFVVGNVGGPVQSMGKLIRKGYHFELGTDGLWMYNPKGDRVELKLIRNSLYMRAEVEPGV